MNGRFDRSSPMNHDRTVPRREDVLLAQFLQGLNFRLKPSYQGSPTKGNGFKKNSSHPNLHALIRQQSHHVDTVTSSPKEVGPYAWVPMATRTAVGYGMQPPSTKKQRPKSAPLSRARSNSVGSIDTSCSGDSWAASLLPAPSYQSHKRSKSGYMKKPDIICIRAFQNGNRDNYARVTANNISQLLEECTAKLGLVCAARKLYLQDGTLVVSPRQMHKDGDVYVSCGEPFRDPFKEMREREIVKQASSWTMNGILLPEKTSKTPKLKTSVTKKMRDLVESQKKRILVFRNGEATKGMEVVANRFDEFLDDCTLKLGLESGAKLLFTAQGQNVESFAQVPVLDNMLSTGRGQILGPIWVSKGEGFSPKGAYSYLSQRMQELKEKMSVTKSYKEQVEYLLAGKDVKSVEVQAMKKEEAEKEKKMTEALLKTLHALHSKLKSELKDVRQKFKQEETTGRQYKFQHISEIDPNSRLVGISGLRLKIHANGDSDSESCKVPVNIKEVMKAGKTKEERLNRLFQTLSANTGLQESFKNYSQHKWFSRAFFADGTEIHDICQLEYDSEIWLSCGEDFIPINYTIFGIAFHKVKIIDLFGKKSIVVKDQTASIDDAQMSDEAWTSCTHIPNSVPIEPCDIPSPQPVDNKTVMTGLPQQEIIRAESTKDDEVANQEDDEQNKAKILANLKYQDLAVSMVQSHIKNRVSEFGPFLQHKEYDDRVVFPELAQVSIGKDEGIAAAQDALKTWIISKDGVIANKLFTDLVLSVRDTKIRIEDEQNIVEGFAVGFSRRSNSHAYQFWNLTKDGAITVSSNPELYLTSVVGASLDVVSKPLTEESNAENASLPQTTQDDSKMENKQNSNSSSSRNSYDSRSDDSREESDLSDSFLDGLGLKGLKERALLRRKGRKKIKGRKPKKKVKASETDTGRDGTGSDAPLQMLDLDFIATLPDEYKGESVLLVVIPRAPPKHPLRAKQRWAMQIPRGGSTFLAPNDGLSSKCRQQNLMWPISDANQWSVDVIEGYLLPSAPKLKRIIKTPDKSHTGDLPVRLKVLKNGDSNGKHAVTVIGPDLSNMSRNVSINLFAGRKSGKEVMDGASSSVKDVEFHQFLERCTDQLRLPFAARRLFDEKGKELFSLNGLDRDQVVYVSSGEGWNDPDVTLVEQQRRMILANLASDVNKIRHFISLRNQTDLIIQVDGMIKPGASVCVGARPSDEEENPAEGDGSIKQNRLYSEEQLLAFANGMLTAHQRAHIRSEERLDKLRKSFHALSMEPTGEANLGSGEDEEFSNPTLARKFSVGYSPDAKLPANAHQCWKFKDGFIQLKYYPKLVLGVRDDNEVKSSHHVVLCTKRVEDTNQRWTMVDDGTIHLRCNPSLALSVATPSLKNDLSGYYGSQLLLTPRMPPIYGNAYQLFIFDACTGYIEAFATDVVNKEITAANKSGVCTYAVLGSKAVDQICYEMESASKGMPIMYFCDACGKAARGKKRLRKSSTIVEFSCGMGNTKTNGIRFSGSFQCLDSGIDLSYKEAEATLALWEMQLNRLKQESSVRVIHQEVRASQMTPAVRLRAHRNGDNSDQEGCLVIGNTINQLLDQCTAKLNLTQAARRLYLVDGELITNMQQLLQPYYPELYFTQPQQNGASNKGRKGSKQKKVEPSPSDSSAEGDLARVLYSRSEHATADCSLRIEPGHSDASQSDLTGLDNDGEKGEEVIKRKHVSFADVDAKSDGENPSDSEHFLYKMDVRIPVDVWVSVGEAFIPLEESDKTRLISLRQREERSLATDYLEIEKHRLRQLQGRRFSGMTSSVDNTIKPVLYKTWSEPTQEEEKLEKSIHDLKTHICEVKLKQSREDSNLRDRTKYRINEDKKVYDIPRSIRIHVYPNGEGFDRARAVFAGNLMELLDRATGRLDLTSAARRLFTSDGEEIFDFEEIKRNQYICVTCGEKFVPYRDRKHKIQMRASWARMNRANNKLSPCKVTPDVRDRPKLALPAPCDFAAIRTGGEGDSLLSASSPSKARPKSAKI